MTRGICCLGLALVLGCLAREPDPPPAAAAPVAKPAPTGSPTLGVWLRSLPERDRLALDPPPAGGVVLAEVLAQGPAALAHLRSGDVIVAVGGEPVRRICDFYRAPEEKSPGAVVRLSVQRRNATFDAAVTLAPAAELYSTSCDSGEAAGCMLLAGQQPRISETMALYEKACRLGLGDACATAAEDYLTGEGAQQDEHRSAELFERSCVLGSGPGYTSVAYQFATGRGVMRDDEHALSLFFKACDELGDPAGCYNVGLMIDNARGIDRDPARARAAYVLGCDGGSSLACTNAGFLFEHGEGGPLDEARAADFYRRACEEGCGDIDPNGCGNLGLLYRHGQGVPEDKARAAELLQKACERDEADLCSYLADMLSEGEGIAPDPPRATELYRKACRLGRRAACEEVEHPGAR